MGGCAAKKVELACENCTYSFLDPFPDNSGHLVSVHVDHGVGDLHLFEGGGESSLGSEVGGSANLS